MRIALSSLVAAVAFFSQTAMTQAQSCQSSMEQNMQKMVAMAQQCGESASLMKSLASGDADSSDMAGSCGGGSDLTGQLQAFEACSRVYVCAVMAYSYGIQHLDEFGGDCTAAANAGLARFPVQ